MYLINIFENQLKIQVDDKLRIYDIKVNFKSNNYKNKLKLKI